MFVTVELIPDHYFLLPDLTAFLVYNLLQCDTIAKQNLSAHFPSRKIISIEFSQCTECHYSLRNSWIISSLMISYGFLIFNAFPSYNYLQRITIWKLFAMISIKVNSFVGHLHNKFNKMFMSVRPVAPLRIRCQYLQQKSKTFPKGMTWICNCILHSLMRLELSYLN